MPIIAGGPPTQFYVPNVGLFEIHTYNYSQSYSLGANYFGIDISSTALETDLGNGGVMGGVVSCSTVPYTFVIGGQFAPVFDYLRVGVTFDSTLHISTLYVSRANGGALPSGLYRVNIYVLCKV